MSIKIICLSCGHPMNLGDAYEEYQGAVRCWGCRAILDISLREGLLIGMSLAGATLPDMEMTEAFRLRNYQQAGDVIKG